MCLENNKGRASQNYRSISLQRYEREVVQRLTTKKGPNLALHPIDLKFYILFLDTPTTNLEPGCSRLLPPHRPSVGEKQPPHSIIL